MKEVAHYIEQILMYHDCVIIPGLGGFVAQDMAASYVKEENIFLPPYRNVSFNPSLSMNDGLFVHEVAKDCGISYNEALLMVRQKINGVKQTLHREGSLYFPGIGCLLLTEEGNYDFEPLLCGVLAPDLYGLDCVYIESVEQVEDGGKTVAMESEKTDPDQDSFSFRIPKNVIRYAVAVVVAAVLYFGCIAPTQHSRNAETAKANVFSAVWDFVEKKSKTEPTALNVNGFKPANETISAKPAAVSAKNVAKATTAKATTKASKNEATTGKKYKSSKKMEYVPKTYAPYTVVIATAIPEAGAYRMVRELRRNGIKGARVHNHCSMYRVVYGAYPSEGEAHNALRQLRTLNNEVFDHSWICRVH